MIQSIQALPRFCACITLTISLLQPASAETEPTLIWADEFDSPGLPDASKWSYDVGGSGWGNRELQFYTKEEAKNARVEDGYLIIEAHNETSPANLWGTTKDYTSARLTSKSKGDWQYGRFEVRAKVPAGRGTWPAIWMLPTGDTYGFWPNSGELDIMEHVGSNLNTIHANRHTKNRNGAGGETKFVPDADKSFHVYAMEWSPTEIRTYVDGEQYYSFENPQTDWEDWPFDHPFHLLLNLAVGGDWGGEKGIDPDVWPQRMVIDYVRIYDMGDSPVLDHDKDSISDSEDPDDDNDGFSDLAELEAGTNPLNDQTYPKPEITLLKNTDFSEGSTGWFKLLREYSDTGDIAHTNMGALSDSDWAATDDGIIEFSHEGPEAGRTDYYLFQPTDISKGLAPGDVVSFRGTASASREKNASTRAMIVVYSAAGEALPASVFAPIQNEGGDFLLTTTLEMGPVRGIVVGFTIETSSGASGTIRFSNLTAKIEKPETNKEAHSTPQKEDPILSAEHP